MKIDHIAIWTQKLEALKFFYEKYFGGKPGEKYSNPKKKFESYFIEFDSGTRLEIMQRADVQTTSSDNSIEYLGIAHFAISTGSKEEVDRLTELLRNDGYNIIGEPRMTGDGCYESVVADPDGNKVEITQ